MAIRRCETQTASSKIRSRVTDSISHVENRYAKRVYDNGYDILFKYVIKSNIIKHLNMYNLKKRGMMTKFWLQNKIQRYKFCKEENFFLNFAFYYNKNGSNFLLMIIR